MESLKKYMYEGLLAGMDNTLAGGDEMMTKAKTELSTIKTYTDHSNHRLWQSGRYGWEGRRYNEGFNVRSLAMVLGYWNKIDSLRIIVTKDMDINMWVIELTFYNSDYKVASNDSKNWEMAIMRYPVSSVKTFPTLLKRYVAPIFDNIETLKKFMEINKVQ